MEGPSDRIPAQGPHTHLPSVTPYREQPRAPTQRRCPHTALGPALLSPSPAATWLIGTWAGAEKAPASRRGTAREGRPGLKSPAPGAAPRPWGSRTPAGGRRGGPATPRPIPAGEPRYLADPLVDVEVELPAHIEAEPVPVAALVVDVDEGDADGVGALRVEGHAVRPTVLRVAQQLVQPLPGGELGLNLVHLLPTSLRRHLGKERSSCPSARMCRHCAAAGARARPLRAGETRGGGAGGACLPRDCARAGPARRGGVERGGTLGWGRGLGRSRGVPEGVGQGGSAGDTAFNSPDPAGSARSAELHPERSWVSPVSGTPHPSWATCSRVWSLLSKEVLPHVRVEFLCIGFCLWHHRKEPGCIL